MSAAYVVGQITIKNPDTWADYRSQVPATLAPWGAELVFRGKLAAILSGDQRHDDIVVIRFPDMGAVNAWYASTEYQALIPLRQAAADVDLVAYEA